MIVSLSEMEQESRGFVVLLRGFWNLKLMLLFGNFHSVVKWKIFPAQSYFYSLPPLEFKKLLSYILFGLFLVSIFFASEALKTDLLLQHNIHNWDIFNGLLSSLSILFCVGTVKYFNVSYSLPMWSMDFQINAMSNTVKNILYTFTYNHTHRKIYMFNCVCQSRIYW